VDSLTFFLTNQDFNHGLLGGKAAADFLKEIRHDEMKHRDAFKK
jgi:hypothetical protein